jgi:hypothetical protein
MVDLTHLLIKIRSLLYCLHSLPAGRPHVAVVTTPANAVRNKAAFFEGATKAGLAVELVELKFSDLEFGSGRSKPIC